MYLYVYEIFVYSNISLNSYKRKIFIYLFPKLHNFPDPVVSEWGEWGACEYDLNVNCQKSRERSCGRAVESTRTCEETLFNNTACDTVFCGEQVAYQMD